MCLKEYTNLQFKDVYVYVHRGTGGYKAPIIIQGKLSELDLKEYANLEVLNVAGRADLDGVHYWVR